MSTDFGDSTGANHDQGTRVPGLQIGAMVGQYKLVKELGAGGMGVVYLAQDAQLERTVAIKFILGAGVKSIKRFIREAEVCAQLSHPNIVKILQFGEFNKLPYIAMECIQGEEYSDYIKRDDISLEQHLKIIVQVAKALHYGHKQGIVHRDIKPSNIFIRTDGTPVVMDFGVARVNQDTQGLTKTGEMVGTMQFMAPEQAEGVKDLDGRADVYALGGCSVLYPHRTVHCDRQYSHGTDFCDCSQRAA